MLKDYFISLTAFEKAHTLVRNRKLWSTILLPGLVFLVIFLFGFYFFFNTVGKVVNIEILEEFGIKKWLDENDTGFMRFILSYTGLVLWILGILFYFSLFKYGWLLVTAPFLERISNLKVYWQNPMIYNEENKPINKLQFAKSVQITLMNMGWQSVYFIVFLILAFIPVIGWVMPIFAVLMELYFMGFVMYDYVMRAHGIAHEVIRRFISSRKGLALGNGFMFYLMMLLPVIGWVLAPAYAMIAAAFTVSDVETL